MNAAAISPWQALTDELDAWAAAGLEAAFWCRDDDAVKATPELDRLLALSARYQVPLVLAVIPAFAEPSLAERLASGPGVLVAQHGWRHDNHAASDAKTIELGGERGTDAVLADLRLGYERLEALFGSRPDMLVPPWNRIDAGLVGLLTGVGYRSLSCFAAEPEELRADGLIWRNTHVDPIDWRGSRSLKDEATVLEPAVALLGAMRRGAARLRPLGLMTHHLVHDEAIWAFTERFVALVHDHPASHWT
jgi:peptidoglycan/xylan/chitin deacetylase (PgdA/CDA1 family)